MKLYREDYKVNNVKHIDSYHEWDVSLDNTLLARIVFQSGTVELWYSYNGNPNVFHVSEKYFSEGEIKPFTEKWIKYMNICVSDIDKNTHHNPSLVKLEGWSL